MLKAKREKMVNPRGRVSYLPQKKSGGRNYCRWKGVLLLFVLFITYFSGLFVNQHFKLRDMQARRQELVIETQKMRFKNEELLKEVELLHTPEYIELLARQELGMIRPGEVLLDINNDRYVFRGKRM